MAGRLLLYYNDSSPEVFDLLHDDREEVDGFLELLAEGEGCVVPVVDGLVAIPRGDSGLRLAEYRVVRVATSLEGAYQ